MFSRERIVGLSIACLAVGAYFVAASPRASADDARLNVRPAVYRVSESNLPDSQIKLAGYGYYGYGRAGWGGYRGYGGYGRGWYGYRPYYRPYYYGGYPAYGYGYPAYGYGYPAYGYGYPGVGVYTPRLGVGVGVW
jgi:hypothetical protein